MSNLRFRKVLFLSIAMLINLGILLFLTGSDSDCDCTPYDPPLPPISCHIEYICPSESLMVGGPSVVVEVYIYDLWEPPVYCRWQNVDPVTNTVRARSQESPIRLESTSEFYWCEWQSTTGPSGGSAYVSSIEVTGLYEGSARISIMQEALGAESPNKLSFIPIDGSDDFCYLEVVPYTQLPSDLTITDLTVTPSEVNPGEPVTIEVAVHNTGKEIGTREIVLVIDGHAEPPQSIMVDGDTSRVKTFTVSRDEPGIYIVVVDGFRDQFEVLPWQFTLTISSSDGGYVSQPEEGIHTYDEGSRIYLYAEANEGWQFDRWDGDNVEDPNSNSSHVIVNEDKEVVAYFIPIPLFVLTSNDFSPDGAIPQTHAYDGSNISPHLEWTGVPAGTESFVLIMEDPEGGLFGGTCVHWIVFNIPSHITSLARGASSNLPEGAVHGRGSDGWTGYYGCEPPPYELHYYHFTIYALDTTLELPQGVEKPQLMAYMEEHILDQAELVGTYYATY